MKGDWPMRCWPASVYIAIGKLYTWADGPFLPGQGPSEGAGHLRGFSFAWGSRLHLWRQPVITLFPLSIPYFQALRFRGGCEKVEDALEESHNTNKTVVRLRRKVRELSLDENEARPLARLLMVFIWKTVSGWLLALREKGNAVGFGRNTNVYITFLKYSCKKSLFNKLHRISKTVFLVGLCLFAHMSVGLGKKNSRTHS